jgi:hypothetical protein
MYNSKVWGTVSRLQASAASNALNTSCNDTFARVCGGFKVSGFRVYVFFKLGCSVNLAAGIGRFERAEHLVHRHRRLLCTGVPQKENYVLTTYGVRGLR